jgi:hypothetical protein
MEGGREPVVDCNDRTSPSMGRCSKGWMEMNSNERNITIQAKD